MTWFLEGLITGVIVWAILLLALIGWQLACRFHNRGRTRP
jgi:hypothetical protein